MDFKTPVECETVVLDAAVIALFSSAITVSAVWSNAPLVITIAWVLSTIINVVIAVSTRIRWHRPAPVPVMAASTAMCQRMRPAVYDRKRY